jgi:hypothetical protein
MSGFQYRYRKPRYTPQERDGRFRLVPVIPSA